MKKKRRTIKPVQLDRPDIADLLVRLWRAENALLSATMGVMEPMQQYMQDYREPVERPAPQPGEAR